MQKEKSNKNRKNTSTRLPVFSAVPLLSLSTKHRKEHVEFKSSSLKFPSSQNVLCAFSFFTEMYDAEFDALRLFSQSSAEGGKVSLRSVSAESPS